MTFVDISWSLNLRFSQYDLHLAIAVLKTMASLRSYPYLCSEHFVLRVVYFHVQLFVAHN